MPPPDPAVTTTALGRQAEELAAQYLAGRGYEIIGRNWRNRWCEIDITARRGGVVYFIEVKYRSTASFGLPAEYVNRDKLMRLTRAALAWTQAHAHRGQYQIDVVSVVGPLDRPTLEHLPDITGLG